jgi:hypothetical protein
LIKIGAEDKESVLHHQVSMREGIKETKFDSYILQGTGDMVGNTVYILIITP